MYDAKLQNQFQKLWTNIFRSTNYTIFKSNKFNLIWKLVKQIVLGWLH